MGTENKKMDETDTGNEQTDVLFAHCLSVNHLLTEKFYKRDWLAQAQNTDAGHQTLLFRQGQTRRALSGEAAALFPYSRVDTCFSTGTG
jgi:hypothetical protein